MSRDIKGNMGIIKDLINSTKQKDKEVMGEAALNLAEQLLLDIHRSADALEIIAKEMMDGK